MCAMVATLRFAPVRSLGGFLLGMTNLSARPRLPVFLYNRNNDEFIAPLASRFDRKVLARTLESGAEAASRIGLDPGQYWNSRLATAVALKTIDDGAGGGFFHIPDEAVLDPTTAEVALGGDQLIVDIQTHWVAPRSACAPLHSSLLAVYRSLMPDNFKGLDGMTAYSMAEYLRCMFLESETTVAVLSSAPTESDRMLTNAEIAGTRELFDRVGPSGRLLNHTVVQPNVSEEVGMMSDWLGKYQPVAWKVYTRVASGAEGEPWTLDDEKVGLPFLEKCRDLGIRKVCSHKGLSLLFSFDTPEALRTLSPRDVGPAAKIFPDIDFLIYHSGYEPQLGGYVAEGPYSISTENVGTNRLVKSLKDSGIRPGSNVYAELGTTWFCLVKRPLEAAHVLGKLLIAVGEDNVLWGTDSIWYGPPQPFVDAFRAFQIPEQLRERYGYPELTSKVKEKILGLNAARVYGIDAEQARANARIGDLAWAREALAEYNAKGVA